MVANGLNVPTIKKATVFHVGEMDINEKEHTSYEGSGLSVSEFPEVWTSIARLGGRSTYMLTNRKGVFLDFHTLGTARNMIKQWGLEQGYIEEQAIYHVPCMTENGDDAHIVFADPNMAFEEYVEYMENELENDEELELDKEQVLNELQKKGYKAMPILLTESMRTHAGPNEVIDLLVTVWAEKFTDLDGVHWEDILDENNYSAPRSVIFNSKLSNWKKELA